MILCEKEVFPRNTCFPTTGTGGPCGYLPQKTPPVRPSRPRGARRARGSSRYKAAGSPPVPPPYILRKKMTAISAARSAASTTTIATFAIGHPIGLKGPRPRFRSTLPLRPKGTDRLVDVRHFSTRTRGLARPFDHARKGLISFGRAGAHFVGFHSRASRCASAICSGVIFKTNLSRALFASSRPCAAAKLNHMWART